MPLAPTAAIEWRLRLPPPRIEEAHAELLDLQPITLTRLVDAGYDGTLVSAQTAGAILYEVRVGPYENLADAQRAAEAMRRSEGLSPALIVHPSEPEEE